MTASEPTANNPQGDKPIIVAGHPGRWRLLSLVAASVAVLIVTISIVQDRRATDREPAGEDALQFVDVTVDDSLANAAAVHASALRDDADQAPQIDAASRQAQIPVPALGRSVLAVTADNGDLVGLRIHSHVDQSSTIEALSTAQTLLTLSPALLNHDVDRAAQRAALVADDPMHDALVAAVRTDGSLTSSNTRVGESLAALLDRVPLPDPAPDQGCDSISSTNAYAVAGVCVQPGSESTTFHNEQDRWVLLFAEPDNWSTVCSALPPAQLAGNGRTIASGTCGSRALLTAAGELPSSDRLLEAVAPSVLTDRHDVATALTLLDKYALPYATLLAGADGHDPNTVVSPVSVPAIVTELTQLMASNQIALDAVRAAYSPDSTPSARHRAAVDATYAMLSSDEVVASLPSDIGQRADALTVLDFFRFAGSFMSAERTRPVWTATAAGVVDGL